MLAFETASRSQQAAPIQRLRLSQAPAGPGREYLKKSPWRQSGERLNDETPQVHSNFFDRSYAFRSSPLVGERAGFPNSEPGDCLDARIPHGLLRWISSRSK